MLRIRIRDRESSVSLTLRSRIRDPEWGKKYPDPGSVLNILDHFSESLETVFGLKILWCGSGSGSVIFLILDLGEVMRIHNIAVCKLINIFNLQEGACSEQSSRMTAMENSSKNAGTYPTYCTFQSCHPMRVLLFQLVRLFSQWDAVSIFSHSQSENSYSSLHTI